MIDHTACPPVIWSIAGQDPSGGAGLSADVRAADAMGVHLCPIIASTTAQNTHGVDGVWPLPMAQLDQQLQTLAQDMLPTVIKTGLLGSVDTVLLVAQWVDRLRATTPPGQDPHQHLALVVDPVFKASSGGQPFDSDALVAAYREHLLPRATVITPNHAEALRLVPGDANPSRPAWPALARSLQSQGVRHVVITGGDTLDSIGGQHHALDWLQTDQAQGWLTAPRIDTKHTHGTGCTFASGVAAALALGHVAADAVVLAKMLTHHAIAHGHAAGQGAGPVHAQAGFAAGAAQGGAPMPWLGLNESLPWLLIHECPRDRHRLFEPFRPPADGLYGIVATSDLVQAAFDAGMTCVQLRHKSKTDLTGHLHHSLIAAQDAQAMLFVNDHWREALSDPLLQTERSAHGGTASLGLHLGQEDLCALSPTDQRELIQQRDHVMLGLSSHSLWELARALGCGPSYVACGPVQPTTTKDMPWLPQGTHNLRWWINNSPAPVVAIGGILTMGDVARYSGCGSAAVCVVRALGDAPDQLAQAYQRISQAVATNKEPSPHTCQPTLPRPVL